jgi:hypothetical protein
MAGIPLEWNALCCFAARGDMEAVQCLVEATVSSRADIREMTVVRKRILPDSRGLFGDTPLHVASIHGHAEIVEYLLSQRADPSAQNDLGQTPLFMASLHGQDKCLEALIMGGADMRRLSVDGLNALDVAGNAECRFLMRSLMNDAEDEEARLRAEATKARLKITMVKWAKASMVDAYKTWKDFALIPENKLDRLIADFDTLGQEQAPCPPPPVQIGRASLLLPPLHPGTNRTHISLPRAPSFSRMSQTRPAPALPVCAAAAPMTSHAGPGAHS